MKRFTFLAAPAVVAGVAAVVLLPGSGNAQGTGERTFKLVEAGNGPFKFIDLPPKVSKGHGPGAGDGFIFANKLTDEAGKAAGTVIARCEATPVQGTLYCDGVFKLTDGTITGTGLTTENSRTTRIAITGGTGAYEGARGSITSVDRSSKDNSPSDDTVHILG